MNYGSIRTISFYKEVTSKFIQTLNPNKAHDHDNASVFMLKMCGSTVVYRPLELIFKEALNTCCKHWKKEGHSSYT